MAALAGTARGKEEEAPVAQLAALAATTRATEEAAWEAVVATMVAAQEEVVTPGVMEMMETMMGSSPR